VAWLVVFAGCVVALSRWLRRHLGLTGLIGAGVVAGAVAALWGVDWEGPVATWMPCRRNWAWLPSYFLRSSPTEALVFEIGDARVKICYGRPRARGRKMLGGAQVPFGQLWRTGANEPTTIRTTSPIVIGGIRVDGGKASLYTVPGPETWEIILNRSTTQWGIESEYHDAIRSQELGRTVVASGRADGYSEILTISVEPAQNDSSILLVLFWEDTVVRVPVTVPAA
jgi:hypothetical protein